ncbi:hypothetical protein QVD17_01429 [Tagetes erecta]|uniref:F-box domain-containing protein n=1 Tax=Tagetes erecta TaxID=13708 RepID=A0AAD8P6S0_TARER|nr:hypothetical protein QVD17_01429 [Tagetes erecta]
MNNLPDHIVCEIFSRIEDNVDRKSVSLTSKRFHSLDNQQRTYLHVKCDFNPNETLSSLCQRFPNLNKVEITFSLGRSRKHVNDQGLSILSNACTFLTDLTLSHCAAVTDTGLSSLAACSKLSSLKLNSIISITGRGMLPIVTSCTNLKKVHLISCSNFSILEWLECLGRKEKLEDLCIKYCRFIGEGALVKLGPTWGKIKRLHFDAGSNYMRLSHKLAVEQWQKQHVSSENMVELTLIKCMIIPGRGLVCILDKCKNLEKIHLDLCTGAQDCDIIGLAQNSRNLRAISIRVPSYYLTDTALVRLTDRSLKSLAQNCLQLESVSLSFSDGKTPSPPSFSLNGILNLIKTCPVKNLFLDGVFTFNNIGMEALCGCDHLQSLELVRCQEISDEGLECVAHNPWLRVLRLTRCVGVTDDGFKPLISSCKLETLVVNDCPQVSFMGVQGAAKSVSYSQNLDD